MIVPFTNINPDIVKRVREKYKGWSREKFFEAALASLRPGSPCGKGTLHVLLARPVEIGEGGLARSELAATLVESCSSFFAICVHDFTLEESRAIKAQKIYWEMAQKFRRSK